MARELLEWLMGSARFRTFAEAHRDKIRKKFRGATDAASLRDVRAELQTVAMQRDVSVNFLVTRAVDSYLRQLPPVEGDARPAARNRRRTAKRGAS